MLTIGHLALGYMVSVLLTKILSISSSSPYYNTLIIVGLIASIIPDIDFLIFFYKNKSLKLQKNNSHRKYLTHIPLFWLAISLIIFIIGFLISNDLLAYSSAFIFVGSFSHLFGDSIEYGIRWFWPFSKKQYIIHKIPKENFKENEPIIDYYWKFFSQIYIKNWTFYIELLLIIITLVSFIF